MQRGGEIGIRTVECLRGRLQAERVASKAAKDEAQLMARRLEELESKLKEEIKSRNRAQKRLKHALKKLESLKHLSLSESSAGSSESWKNVGSRMEEMRRVKGLKEAIRDDGLDSTCSGDSGNQMTSQEGSWSSVGTAHSKSKESNKDDVRQAEASFNTDDTTNDALNQPDYSDDTLALVPVEITPHSDVKNSDNVQNVLIALSNVKEKLRNSLERRATALSSPKLLYGQ